MAGDPDDGVIFVEALGIQIIIQDIFDPVGGNVESHMIAGIQPMLVGSGCAANIEIALPLFQIVAGAPDHNADQILGNAVLSDGLVGAPRQRRRGRRFGWQESGRSGVFGGGFPFRECGSKGASH